MLEAIIYYCGHEYLAMDIRDKGDRLIANSIYKLNMDNLQYEGAPGAFWKSDIAQIWYLESA